MRLLILLVAAVTALCTLSGCDVLGVALYKTAGSLPVPALYTLPVEPTIVIVESYHNPSASELDSSQIARYLTAELQSHEVGPMIDPEKFEALRDEDRVAFGKLNIAEIARKLGVKQVVYVDLISNDADGATGAESLRVTMSTKVRVIDAADGATRWPSDQGEGFPVGVRTPVMRVGDGVSESSIRQRAQSMVAIRIARIFYKHSPEDDAAVETP